MSQAVQDLQEKIQNVLDQQEKLERELKKLREKVLAQLQTDYPLPDLYSWVWSPHDESDFSVRHVETEEMIWINKYGSNPLLVRDRGSSSSEKQTTIPVSVITALMKQSELP